MRISKEKCEGLTDAEIVRRSLEDIDYFTCIYLKFEPQLMRYILRLSHVSQEEAEDILQEGFIKIWKNLNAFDPSMKLSSWVYRIIHNQTVSHWRKGKTTQEMPSISIDGRVSEVLTEELKEGSGEAIKEDLLQETLNGLPSKYKEVILLKYFEEMSYEEISDVLKIPEGTVSIRLNRAKKAIAKNCKCQ